jgi:DNA-binding HxlR family transcriptional regulator
MVANAGDARRLGDAAAGRARRRALRALSGSALGGSAPVRELDALIHHRIRLGILSALAGVDSLSFNALKALLKTSDGNLSVHARRLEDAGYVRCTKSFAQRRPRTEYALAADGRRALQRYLGHMEALIQAARSTLG